MKQIKKMTAMLLMIILTISSMISPVSALGYTYGTEDTALEVPFTDNVSMDGVDAEITIDADDLSVSGRKDKISFLDNDANYKEDDIVTVIVELESKPLLEHMLMSRNYGDVRLFASSDEGRLMENDILSEQQNIKAQIKSIGNKFPAIFKSKVDLSEGYSYTTVLNGFSMQMRYGDIKEAANISGVKNIFPVAVFELPETDFNEIIPFMHNSAEMVGAPDTWDKLGYDGSGTIVAILDSGLDTYHEAFMTEPQTVRYTEQDIKALVSSKTLASNVKDGSITYVNDKVPYAYDYADRDPSVVGGVDHGTHVAGTIAGDCENLTGVAPKAQLMIMKVFGDGTGSTSDDIILAGLDDAVKLGADSINMSLGSGAGFSEHRDETVDTAYERCYEAGISLLIAAGNDYSSALMNKAGNNLTLSESPDSAMVGSPSTSFASLSVASVQNSKTDSRYFEISGVVTPSAVTGSAIKIAYSDANNANTQAYYDAAAALVGSNEYYANEYVVVPGLGEEKDFEGIDVQGKIALIQRGVINFSVKAENAKKNGAVAVIIYNNASGAIVPSLTEDTIPLVGISQSDGQKLIDADSKIVTFNRTWIDRFDADDGGQPSGFSSWGPTPDLRLKPEIAAPGGNIYSAVNNGGYETMSGTSMATPHMAGMAALVRQYLNDKFSYTSAEMKNMTDSLLMSTAKPAKDTENNEYSPRKQGAGVANVYNAITTNAYLSVEGNELPKAELGESSQGIYSFRFSINNLSDKTLEYTIDTVSLTEGIITNGNTKYIDQNSRRLEKGTDFIINYSGDIAGNTINVPANSSADIFVELELTEKMRNYIDENFENGNYVEGYVYLNPSGIEEEVALGLPYLGFYGDWEKAPAFENTPDEDYLLTPVKFAAIDPSGAGYYIGYDGGSSADENFNPDRLAFSPRLNGASIQHLATILSTRRNIENFSAKITDDDNNTLYSLEAPSLRKTYYYQGAGVYSTTQIFQNGWTGRYYNEQSGKYDGEVVPAGQYYNYIFSGNVGQNDDALQTKELKVYLDDQSPVISDIQIVIPAEGENKDKFMLTMLVKDDHYINFLEMADGNDKVLLDGRKDEFKDIAEPGSTIRLSFNLTGIGKFLSEYGLNPGRLKLNIFDYALNSNSVYVDIGPQSISLENISVDVGESKQINIVIRPERTASMPITWSSDDTEIATVDENGAVKGIKNGVATITATSWTGLSRSCLVTVGTGEGEIINTRFEYNGLYYKVIGPNTVQLIADESRSSSWAVSYPSLEGEVIIPQIVTYQNKQFKITSIGENAFYMNEKITAVSMPEGIKTIGNSAFSMCYGLSSINLVDSIEQIEDNSFFLCEKLDTDMPANIKSIGKSAFQSTGLSSVNLPEGIIFTGDSAFYNCTNLKSANIPASLTDIKPLMYGNCTALEDVHIAEGVKIIPKSCFYGTTALKQIDIPEGVTELAIGAFYGSGLTSIELPESCTVIGDFAYAGLHSCPDIIVPDSVEYVGARAFWWCWELESVVFGAGVTYIGPQVLTGALMKDGSDIIPEVRSESAGIALRRSGFVGKITKDGMPYSVYTGTDFTLNGLTYTPISEDEVMLTYYNDKVQKGIITIPEKITNEGDDITYTVTAIDDKIFHNKYDIQEIHLPDTITHLGERAFDQLHELEYINMPKNLESLNNSWSYLGWNPAVAGEWQVDELVIPSGLKNWGTAAFAGNKYKSLVISEGIENVGDYAFSSNNFIDTISLPSTLASISDYAFQLCIALKDIELPESLEYIGNGAFNGTPITNIQIPDSVSHIGNSAFNGSTYDEVSKEFAPVGPIDVKVGSGLKSIGWNAFRRDANIQVILNSQRNKVIEFTSLDKVPVVVWDGRTDIPANDGSYIPKDTTVEVTKNVYVNGELTVEGKLIIPAGVYVVVQNGTIIGEANIEGRERIVSKLPSGPVDPVDPTPVDPTPIDPTPVNPGQPSIPAPVNPTNPETNGNDYLSQYRDLNSNMWYSKSVAFMLEKGYMNGVSDKEFAPNGTLTRAQLVTILHRISGLPSGAYQTSFTDVYSGKWYTAAIEWAVATGIIQGYEDNTFRSEQAVTREQIALILYRNSNKPYSDFSLNGFSDADKVSGFALDAMRWAVEQGLIQGSNGRLNPSSSATRAEIATILTRYIDK